jgi:hypothetical protein
MKHVVFIAVALGSCVVVFAGLAAAIVVIGFIVGELTASAQHVAERLVQHYGWDSFSYEPAWQCIFLLEMLSIMFGVAFATWVVYDWYDWREK